MRAIIMTKRNADSVLPYGGIVDRVERLGMRRISFAKVTAPSPIGILPRKRLFQQINKLRPGTMLWIVGPPGAGKTSLVSGYLHHCRRPYIWYQIDEGDADPATFFYYLGLAVQKLAPAGQKPLPLLTPEYLQAIPTFTLRYFEQFFNRLEPHAFLAFDNYQETAPDAILHRIIRQALSVLPPELNMLIMSRRMPPPLFARLRAHEKIAVMAWDDLRLHREETKAIVRARGGRSWPYKTVEKLHQAADGWPAGLTMMIERLKAEGVDTVIAPPRLQEEVFDYFADEVFDRAERPLQQLLMQTAFLPKITALSARALTGLEQAGTLLAELSKSGYFTTQHQSAEIMYEFHPLFREFLQNRAREFYAEGPYRELLSRAAGLLEQAGQTEAAVELLRQIDAWEPLEQTILKHSQTMIEQGRGRTLEAWIRSLPPDRIRNNGWLCYWLGLCLLPVDFIASRDSLIKAFSLFERSGDQTGQLLAWCAVVDSYLYAWDDFAPLDRWIAWLDEHGDMVFQTPLSEVEAAVVISMTGALINRQPHHRDILKWMERLEQLMIHPKLNPVSRLRLCVTFAFFQYWIGNHLALNRLETLFNQIAGSIDMSPLVSITRKWIESAVYIFTDQKLERGLELMHEGLALGKKTGVSLFDIELYGLGVNASLYIGDLVSARFFLDCMERVGVQGKNLQAFYHHLMSWCAFLSNDPAQAWSHAVQSHKEATASGRPFDEALAQLSIAELLFEQGKVRAAEDNLRKVQAFAERTHSRYFGFMCNLIRARFKLERSANWREDRKCRDALAAAMSMGREYGISHIYWAIPAWMTKLCLAALELGIEIAYVRQLIRKYRLFPDPPPFDCDPWPWEIRIFTLGRFVITRDDRPLEFPAKAPHRILSFLKGLIACGRHGASEEQMTDLLWPDAEGDMAHKSFEITLHRLRKLLGQAEALQMENGRVRLNPRICWVDAWAFEHLLNRADELRKQENEKQSRAFVEKALKLYGGAFLAGEKEEPWIVSPAEHLRGLFFKHLWRLGRDLEELGQWHLAADYYERSLKEDDCREETYQHLMLCYQKLGRPDEAALAYQRCQKKISSIPRVAPAPKAEAIHAYLLSR
jgi:DNA-binding SARP family transcriptional activator